MERARPLKTLSQSQLLSQQPVEEEEVRLSQSPSQNLSQSLNPRELEADVEREKLRLLWKNKWNLQSQRHSQRSSVLSKLNK